MTDRKDDEPTDHPPTALGEFRVAWRELAADGWCDAIDGAEYDRVVEWWVRHGMHRCHARWILHHANVPLGGGTQIRRG